VAWAQAVITNLLAAAMSTVPVLATGLTRLAVPTRGQKLKGVLLLHLVLGVCFDGDDLAGVVGATSRARRTNSIFAELSAGG